MSTPKKGDIGRVTAKRGVPTRSVPGGRFVRIRGKIPRRRKGYRLKVGAVRRKAGVTWVTGPNKGWWYNADAFTFTQKKQKITTPVPGYKATTPFGKKPSSPGVWTTFGYHEGTDWAAPHGARVVAVRAGTVHRRWDNVLGNICLLSTSEGDFWFCHLRGYWGANGRKVKAGDQIGTVGDTGSGAPFGPHLHVSRRRSGAGFRSTPLDPMSGW